MRAVSPSGASAWRANRLTTRRRPIDTAWMAISQWIAPRVLGASFAHPGEVHAALDRDFRGHNMAKAGVEMGMWAIAAEQAGLAALAIHRRHAVLDRDGNLARHPAVAGGAGRQGAGGGRRRAIAR